MGKFEELRDKAEKFEIKKSWQYLAYIAVVLPGILFLLAYLLRSSGTGVMLARMFHTYNLYVSSPVPNLAPFNGTGVVGLAALVYLVVWGVRRKDWLDLGITLALGAANAAYFLLEWNYTILRLLNLTGGVF